MGLDIEEHHEHLAGVIIEPLIQGAGGMIVWPADAIQKIARLCKEHHVLLIFDEVMTGFGRTGKLFAMDRVNIVPDMICLSKGLTGGTLPLAVTMVREEIYQAFLDESKGRMFFHGHSFTGNPISCAAAVANIRLFLEPEALENLERIEKIQMESSESFRKRSDIIDVRTCGSMAAIEIDGGIDAYLSEFSTRLANELLKKGLFIRPLGNIIYLLPPYCSSNNDLKFAWDLLQTAICEV